MIKSPKVLMLVIKNTACIDFALPLLVRLSKDGSEVAVMYCTMSRRKILRKSEYVSTLFLENRIREYDLLDTLPRVLQWMSPLLRRVFFHSRWDFSSNGVLRRGVGRLERALSRWTRVVKVLGSGNWDLFLMDNTARTQFPGREDLYEFLGRERKKVVLLPHAPHHIYPDAFTAFDEFGEALPDYCEYWLPALNDEPWRKVPSRRSQFHYVGYPGLDSSWLNQALARRDKALTRNYQDNSALNCLFIIRKFVPPGATRTDEYDEFNYDFEEIRKLFEVVEESIRHLPMDVNLLIKPHPSNDFVTLQKVVKNLGLANARIVYEPTYALLPILDFSISLYSTILFVPAMAGIPTVLLGSSVQDVAHEEPTIRKLYEGLTFYLEDPSDLSEKLPQVAEIAIARRTQRKRWKPDMDHLREFYPENSLERCLERIHEGSVS